MIAVELFP